MNVTDAVINRATIRGFKPDPVPEETIREVIEIARNAPSNGNTQPWYISVVSGEARDNLQKAIFEGAAEGMQPNPQWPPGGMGLQGIYKERQYACADRYYGTMGIQRHEKDKRQELTMRNWEFFGAPHAAFLSMPNYMHRAHALDLGIFLQTIMLLFVERGIASCPQGALAAFPDVVRKFVHLPEENAILCGLSFGYEDVGAQINKAKMDREPLENIASFAS